MMGETEPRRIRQLVACNPGAKPISSTISAGAEFGQLLVLLYAFHAPVATPLWPSCIHAAQRFYGTRSRTMLVGGQAAARGRTAGP